MLEPLTVACQLTTYETARAEQSYANVCRVCTVRVCICTCGAFPRKRPEGETDFFQFSVNAPHSRLRRDSQQLPDQSSLIGNKRKVQLRKTDIENEARTKAVR